MTTVPNLPDGSRYLTLVIRVPPPESPDYALLHQITHHPWVRQLAAGDHLNLNLKQENDHGPARRR